MIIGGHAEDGFGSSQSIDRMKSLGFNAMQCFVIDPGTYFLPKGSEVKWQATVAQKFASRKREVGMTVSVHGNYISNFAYAGPNKNSYKVSILSLSHLMWCAHSMEAEFMVTHVGSHKETSIEVSRELVIAACCDVLTRTAGQNPILLLETAACGGTQVADLAFLKDVVETVKSRLPGQKHRIGMCLDLAHSYAAGHDFTKPSVVKSVIDSYGSCINLVHMNNPEANVVLGKHLDRHKSIWTSCKFTVEQMLYLVESFRGFPMVMEMTGTNAYEFASVSLRKSGILDA